MADVFAITTRGLETITAQEMRQSGLAISKIAYRRVETVCQTLDPILHLRTADDVFIKLADWQPVTHLRSELEQFVKRSAELRPETALTAIRVLRAIPRRARFSVTANFVGKRNYTAPEIKMSIQAGIGRSQPAWDYTEDDHDADINLRVFIEHETALVGIRIPRFPLHRRAYKTDHLPGSLKPTAAAAMLLIAGAAPGMSLIDPFCGTGTILIEGALQGLDAAGGDVQLTSAQHTRINAGNAQVRPITCQWDAQRLPLASASADLAVSNLPWGQQIIVNQALKDLYRVSLREIRRVVKRGGSIVLLTSAPELLDEPAAETTEISLFGQKPHIVSVRNGR